MYAQGTGHTDKGLERDGNEDSFLVDNDAGLYVVCDGMGGHAAGEVASKLAVDVVSKVIGEHASTIDRVREGEVDQTELLQIAERAVVEASSEVYERATADSKLSGMGTTLTLLLMLRDKAVMAHVGDTRLYLIRGQEGHQISTDHTLFNELVKMGSMDLGDEKSSHLSHVLSRAIGSQASVQVDTLLLDVLPGDRLVLCTDGVSDHLSGEADLLHHAGTEFEGMATRLVQFANDSGGHDNCTVVTVRIEADEAEQEDQAEHDAEVLAKIEALGSNYLFEDLTLAQLTRILEICEIESHGKGAVLLEEGAPCSSKYVLLEGHLDVSRAGESIGKLSVGEGFGDNTLLEKRPARASITAIEDSRVLRIDGGKFRALVQGRPFLGVALLAQLGQHLGQLIESQI